MGVSKESISKFLIGNRFHVKLRILSPENCKKKLTGEKLKGWSNSCMTILNCWYGTTESWQISWGISFHTNASTSVAVTNGTSFSFLRTCSYLILHYIKIPNLVLYDLDWLFKLKTHWVAEESERLICEICTKTKFYKIYVVTVNKHTIKDQKSYYFGNIFISGNG